MATPPPLPPNRPIRQRSSNSEQYVNTREKQPATPTTPSPSPSSLKPHGAVGPRHSWTSTGAPGVSASLGPLPPLPPSSPIVSRHQVATGLPPSSPPPLSSSPFSPFSPPLPPEPYLLDVKASSPSLMESMTLFPGEDENLTLTELVDNYSSLFPLKVRVVKGFYDERREDCAIASGELYHLHFVKRSKVISIYDAGGNKYVIPLNSATRFGLIHEHSTQTFSTVEDIINTKPLPRVVCATTNYVGNTEESSVVKNEILIIKGVEKGGLLRRRQATLKVFSIIKNSVKTLTKDVYGKFTADPYKTQMYLPEFLKHLTNPEPIPCKAMLYLDFESEEPLPDFLTSEAVTMQRLYVQTSIIASPLEEEDLRGKSRGTDTSTIDIPITLDIEVNVIPPADDDDDDYEKLTYNTMHLIATFDPSSAANVVAEEEEDTDYSYATQSQFFKTVRKGFEKEGLNIEMPKKVRTMSRIRSGTRVSPDQDEEDYENMTEVDKRLGTVSNLGRLREAPPSPYIEPRHHKPNASASSAVYELESPPTTPPPSPPTVSPSSSPPTTPPPSPPRRAAKNTTSKQKKVTIRPLPAAPAELPPRTIQRPASASTLPSKPASKEPSIPRQSSDDVVFGSGSSPVPVPKMRKSRSHSHSAPPPPTLSNIEEHTAPSSKTEERKVPSKTEDRERKVPSKTEGRKISSTPQQATPSGTKDSQGESLQSAIDDLTSRLRYVEEREANSSTDNMKDVLARLDQAVSNTEMLQAEVQRMNEEIERLNQQVMAQDSRQPGADHINAELEALSCTEVQKLLELMGMTKYQGAFKDKGVDGSILAQCDDQVLQEELSVNLKLDRIRITQVISGKRTVGSIMQRAYVAFEPKK